MIATSTQLAIQQPASIETGALGIDAETAISSFKSMGCYSPEKGATMSKKPMSIENIEPPVRCGLYSPGHEVHWIPGIRFIDEPRIKASISFSGKDSIAVIAAGEEIIFFNHEPNRLKQAVSCYGMKAVSINPLRSMIYVKTSQSTSLVFNLSKTPIANCH